MRVCIVSESVYPVVRGGLSEWAHLLIKTLKEVEFDVFCITVEGQEEPVYEKLPNIRKRIIIPVLNRFPPSKATLPESVAGIITDCLRGTLNGTPMNLENYVKRRQEVPLHNGWLLSKNCWKSMLDYYRQSYPEGSFTEFYWSILGLNAIILDTITVAQRIPKADVYHSLSTGYAGVTASIAKLMHRKPMIVTEQGLYLVERKNEMSRLDVTDWYRRQSLNFSESIVKTSYKYADAVVPPCKHHVAVEESLGVDMNKVKVIDNGIEIEKFTPGPPRDGSRVVVGCFARVVPIKGIDVLIKAAKIVLEKHDAEFLVLGEVQDKVYFQECQHLVAELGLADRFKFLGHTNALEWYRKVDIFTLSSLSEGVPYALLEAMSCGLPAVCTAVGGVPEIIREDTGFVVPPSQPDKLAGKLGLLIENKELRRRMGLRAIEVARENYRIEKTASSFHELYQGLQAKYRGVAEGVKLGGTYRLEPAVNLSRNSDLPRGAVYSQKK